MYEVSIAEKAKLDVDAVKKAVGRFKLEKVEAVLVGDVSKDDEGTCLKARGSGAKFMLANRPKKDDGDTPDVLGQIEAKMKEGKSSFQVTGVVIAEKGVQTIHLESAEAVEKK